MDYESVRQQTKSAVQARPFTRMTGKPSYEQKEKIIDEEEELAMAFTVSYPWSGPHGLLAEVMGALLQGPSRDGQKLRPPAHPPVYDPAIVAGGMTQAAIRVTQAMNDTTKPDYAVLEGFREGFGENFRKAFDKKILRTVMGEGVQIQTRMYSPSRVLRTSRRGRSSWIPW